MRLSCVGNPRGHLPPFRASPTLLYAAHGIVVGGLNNASSEIERGRALKMLGWVTGHLGVFRAMYPNLSSREVGGTFRL